MPTITLRQAVMLSLECHLGQDGDRESLARAARALGATESHGLGGMDEASARVKNVSREFRENMESLDRFRQGLGGTAEDKAQIFCAHCEDWIEKNTNRYADGINVPAVSRAEGGSTQRGGGKTTPARQDSGRPRTGAGEAE